MLIGSALAFWRSYTTNTASLGSEAAEFAVLRRQAAGDLLRPWRPLAQMLGIARMRGQ